MNVFTKIETYIVSLVIGFLSHWLAHHPGVMDPFVSGTLAGAILHALHNNGNGSTAPPRVGGSV